jgi:hypothetical protein
MAAVPVPGYQAYWADKRQTSKSEYQQLVAQFPDADAQLKQLFKLLCDIEDVAGYTPASVGDSDQWSSIVNTAEENQLNPCKALTGKILFSALYGTYTVTLKELRALLKASSSAGQTVTTKCAAHREDGFKEVRRRKRNSSNETAPTTKKAVSAAEVTPQTEVPTRNFFAPLRAPMDTESAGAETTVNEETVPGKTGRPPPIILTSQTNLSQLQKQLKNVVKGDFEFRSTRNGTRVVTKDMADFKAVKSHFTKNSLSYYYFFPKSQKPIKAVIRHLPPNTPAKDISEELENLGFDVVSVKQMTTTRRSPSDETTTRNLPLFLITLPRTAKPQDIFKLPSLCHISIKVEAYRAQTGLTQCHNCQQFGHVWANCKQPPPFVCGAEAATCTRSAQRRLTLLLRRRAATAG